MNEVYEILLSDNPLDLAASITEFVPRLLPNSDRKRLLSFAPKVVEDLLAQKARIEEDIEGYRTSRDRVLGDLSDEKASNRTRAGQKFQEISDQFSLLDCLSENPKVLDLCGAPGAFSLFILKKIPTASITGFSLRPGGIAWFEELLAARNFRSFYGLHEDGDLYSAGNRESLKEHSPDCSLVVADGGFEENSDQQELVLARLVLCECSAALSSLAPEGNFVCKFFDVFSELTRSIIFCLARLFKQTFVVKPASSRVVNSERYVVGLGFRAELEQERAVIQKLLEKAADVCTDSETPHSVLPEGVLVGDRKFVDSLEVMTMDISMRQTAALKKVLDCRDKKKRMRRI